MLRILATALPSDSGSVTLDGQDIFQNAAGYCEKLGYLPQRHGYYPHYTLKQYLTYVAALKDLPPAAVPERIAEMLEMMALTEVAHKRMRELSGGMLWRAGLAMTLLNDPKVLLLDEPTAGLDTKECTKLKLLLSQLSADRIILISTHIISDVAYIAKEIILLRDKTVYMTGSKEALNVLVQGKVFETEIPLSQVGAMQQTYQVIAFQNAGEQAKVRFLANE